MCLNRFKHWHIDNDYSKEHSWKSTNLTKEHFPKYSKADIRHCSTTMTVTMGDDRENPVTLTECSIIPPSDSTSDGLRGASRATIISSVLQHHHGRSKCLPNQGSMSKKVESSWSLFPPGSWQIGPNCLPRKRALYCTSSFTRVCPLSQPFSTRNGKKEKNTLKSFSRNLLTGLTWTTENLVKVISKHLKNFHSIHVWPVSSGRKNLVSPFSRIFQWIPMSWVRIWRCIMIAHEHEESSFRR